MMQFLKILLPAVFLLPSALAGDFQGQCLHSSVHLFGALSCRLAANDQPDSVFAYEDSNWTINRIRFQNHDTTSKPPPPLPASPWDLDPICTQHLSDIDAPLCIYTSTKFAHGRGLSVFTTPNLAASLSKFSAFYDDTLDAHAINEASNVPWKTAELPGRGYGLVATRKIMTGDRITAYTPVLIAIRSVGSLITSKDLEYLFRRAIDQLPSKSRDAFMNLARSFDLDDYKVQDIVHTNSFEFDIDGEMHLAMFPETSRINHDCGPNSQYHLNSSLLTHFVQAARPIAVGEEISISYAYPTIPRSQRLGNLEDNFQFTCTCQRCTDRHSDTRVERITVLENVLNDVSPLSPAAGGKGPKLAQELIKLYEKERLHAMLVRPYGLAAQAYSALKDAKNAKKYAKLAVQFGLLKEGETGEDVKGMRELERDPASHWSWGTRTRW